MTKLTIAQVRDIKFGNAPVAVLKKKHKVTGSVIYSIRNGVAWKHIKPAKANNLSGTHTYNLTHNKGQHIIYSNNYVWKCAVCGKEISTFDKIMPRGVGCKPAK